jgi:hypothetical protein
MAMPIAAVAVGAAQEIAWTDCTQDEQEKDGGGEDKKGEKQTKKKK